MNVAIRTDASSRIGLGHLARCRTLAQALQTQGAAVHFVCRAHPGHQIDALRAEGHSVTALPAPPLQNAADAEDYAVWLGVSQDQDAEETRAAIRAQSVAEKEPAAVHWLIVDHYALDTAWEQRLRPTAQRILVIDDLANRSHDCDWMLDQNLAPDAHGRYVNLLPPSAQCLFGPRYALLRPEYAKERQRLSRHPDVVHRVLIFFGGTDPDNLSGRALQALSHPSLAQLHIDLVIGANNPYHDRLVTQAEARGNTQLYRSCPHLADLMAQADLAIGAGGTTTWERCCLGLPSLVVSIAENQQPTCEVLANAGVIAYLGHKDAVSVERLRQAIQALVDNPKQRLHLMRTGTDLVDGQGALRVTQALLAESGS